MTNVQRSFEEISAQLSAMRSRASAPEADLLRTVPKVSGWCAAQHLDHLAKVSSSVLRRLTTTGHAPPGRGITFLGRLVLGIGWIPRGRGKSPERLQGTCVAPAELLASLAEMETLMQQVDVARLADSRTPTVGHPKFGGLTPAQALRFISIHNAHHLKILEDIARA
jgi:DinB superfamily